MTPVVIAPNQEAAGRTRQGTFAPAQPCATRDSAQIKPTCVAGETHPHGIAGVRELVTVRIATLVAGERIVATIRCSKRPNSPANFQSAHASRAVTAGVLSVISAPLRLFILRADDVAAIQSEIEALAARLAAAKGKAERAVK